MKVALDGSPRFVVCRGTLRLCDCLPARVLREPLIDLDEGSLIVRNFIGVDDRIDGTLGNAIRTVDAL